MLIDYTHFQGILNIGLSPDTGAPSATQEAERARINQYIEVYEKEYLVLTLGVDMYVRLMSVLNGDVEDEVMEELLGLLTKKYSPIACYVYFKYLSLGNSHVTRVGTVTSADDEAVSPMYHQIMAWNDMVTMNEEIGKLLKHEKGFKPARSMYKRINDMGI